MSQPKELTPEQQMRALAIQQHKVEAEEWLKDPVTRAFFAMVASETYEAREEALNYAVFGDAKAFASAAKVECFRWVLDDAKEMILDIDRMQEQLAKHGKEAEDHYKKKEKPKT